MGASAGEVQTKPTKAYDDQKAGTSGLRKKTSVFLEKENYLHNFIQSLFDAMEQLGDKVVGQTIGLGGDGRYFNIEAAQIILKLAAGNGIKKVLVGQDGLMATPAMSALIRRRELYGGLIMSASHNPAGKDGDWGCKFNYKSGEPAPEKITNKMFECSKSISELKMLDMPDVDLSKPGTHTFGDFEVEVISFSDDYFATLQEVFDFGALKKFVARSDFSLVYDALWAVTAAYAKPLFCDLLGCKEGVLRHAEAKDDFGGGHPDPNLTYAKDLVDEMWDEGRAADFAAASDGDGDRNMILGRKFFITPSDSVAMIAANAQESIPYFKGGLKGVARSMPTSTALGKVAEGLGVPSYEVPTGWKFFGNLMDAGKCSICGEESFGTSSDHVREKDGLWAVLAWLSILAHKNKDVPEGSGKLVGVEDIAMEHWNKFGRNFFMRYDYEGVESDKASKVIDTVKEVVQNSKKGDKIGDFELEFADDFEYNDPIDGSVASNQGLRLVMQDGSRIVFRLSGTGSSGATIRLYIEQYSEDKSSYGKDAKEVMEPIIRTALEMSKLREHTGRDEPTVIT